jgi:hypothetical protein
MLGSGAATPVSGCDIAVVLRLHSNAVDRIAIAEGATKLDGDFMIISDQIQDGHSVPMRNKVPQIIQSTTFPSAGLA